MQYVTYSHTAMNLLRQKPINTPKTFTFSATELDRLGREDLADAVLQIEERAADTPLTATKLYFSNSRLGTQNNAV